MMRLLDDAWVRSCKAVQSSLVKQLWGQEGLEGHRALLAQKCAKYCAAAEGHREGWAATEKGNHGKPPDCITYFFFFSSEQVEAKRFYRDCTNIWKTDIDTFITRQNKNSTGTRVLSSGAQVLLILKYYWNIGSPESRAGTETDWGVGVPSYIAVVIAVTLIAKKEKTFQ